MRGKYLFGALAGVAVLVAAGCSTAGGDDPSAAGRSKVVTVDMTDNAFRPGRIEVAEGDEVVFRFVNQGRLVHEAFIGDEAAQDDHAREMAGGGAHHAGMHTDGAEAPMVTVQPGAKGELRHRFDHSGTVLIGCHQPGHWDAGMKATIDVA